MSEADELAQADIRIEELEMQLFRLQQECDAAQRRVEFLEAVLGDVHHTIGRVL